MTDTNHAEQQARAQLKSIRAMVAALTVDYDRLQELQDIADGETDTVADDGEIAERLMTDEERAEWAQLKDAAGECTNEDDARRAIEEDALCVEVRSHWVSIGETFTPDQFRIVLCTGGPHVEIVGDLDENREPIRAWLVYQDWGTSKTELFLRGDAYADLLAYCRVFYFGE